LPGPHRNKVFVGEDRVQGLAGGAGNQPDADDLALRVITVIAGRESGLKPDAGLVEMKLGYRVGATTGNSDRPGRNVQAVEAHVLVVYPHQYAQRHLRKFISSMVNFFTAIARVTTR